MTNIYIQYAIIGGMALLLGIVIGGILKNSLENVRKDLKEEMEDSVKETGRLMEVYRQTLKDNNEALLHQLKIFQQSSEQSIKTLTRSNEERLDKMQETVDEKLHKTLEERLGQSFALVSQKLEEVTKSMGEMQNLAQGVGDLKKVLSNVKTRGILGEVQLGAILEQILSPEQYGANVSTTGSKDVVEYAVKLPGIAKEPVWLPIDSKFPLDTYEALMEAYDKADQETVLIAKKALEQRIKAEAKDISSKYIYPPKTTDFAILFLPVEGLYAEVCRMGLIEKLQNEYKVNIAGPTTLAAFLNSLQMGFKTLAIQKRSGEVWSILGEVKTEFGKFETTLKKAQERITQAGSELDSLVGVRTRVMQQKLSKIGEMPELKEGSENE